MESVYKLETRTFDVLGPGAHVGLVVTKPSGKQAVIEVTTTGAQSLDYNIDIYDPFGLEEGSKIKSHLGLRGTRYADITSTLSQDVIAGLEDFVRDVLKPAIDELNLDYEAVPNSPNAINSNTLIAVIARRLH